MRWWKNGKMKEGSEMIIVDWILQILFFLIVWKLTHILFWYFRRKLSVPSLLLAAIITACIAVLAVIILHVVHGVYPLLSMVAILLGLASGEYEYNRTLSS
nr:hypothetical protein [Bacilli bacterium]